uniref:LOW QUALITY PROTEIN: ELKS/Rab6-interacting/CAST family member 1-like n=1 Tax=Saccoglossus kowalevskii TaxID=10224 RepID=A0ABM0MAN0_SACKO|nr:PREDICTED: LOW QUALITY PROTEIN: ELKS/Rab6-interacting/CAST family member 1-like [Saccoglossus kowalevskii]
MYSPRRSPRPPRSDAHHQYQQQYHVEVPVQHQQIPATVSGRTGQSPSHASPRISRPQLHARSHSLERSVITTSSGHSPMPMEQIQSLSAAYNTSLEFMPTADNTSGGPSTSRSHTLPRSVHISSPQHTPSHSRSNSLGSGIHAVVSTTTDFGQHKSDHTGISSNITMASPQLPQSHELRQVRDTLLLDLQTQLAHLQKENANLKKELEVKENKLQSSMNSIKTFWSPELKKERALRKEENSKLFVLAEQQNMSSNENQELTKTIQSLQDELHTQRDLKHHLEDLVSFEQSPGRGDTELKTEKERQVKELFLLRKTLEEMELRIDTQKQTLAARDESIKKLLEMLQSKGLPVQSLEENRELDRLRTRLIESEAKVTQLEHKIALKDKGIGNYKQELALNAEKSRKLERQLGSSLQSQDSPKATALKTIIEVKDGKIAALESQVEELEERLSKLRSSGAISPEERTEEIKQIEEYRGHSKFMKRQIDQLKSDLAQKHADLQTTKTKLDTLTIQLSDKQAHFDVLKESLAAKEQHSNMLQADVEALRARIEEKEAFIDRKNKQISSLSEERSQFNNEISELRDMLDIKDRKINVIQRKLDNLQEQLSDKDIQLSNVRERMKSMQTDHSSSDSAVSSLEEALSDKERMIEHLKEQREREDAERLEESEMFQKQVKELKDRVYSLQKEVEEKETSLMDLKDQASSLTSSAFKKDTKLSTMERSLQQKSEDLAKMEMEIKRKNRQFSLWVKEERERESSKDGELGSRVKSLEDEIDHYRDQVSKSQLEVDRLLDILKQMEEEKNAKDQKIAELEGQLKDASKRLATLKREQVTQKKKNAQLLEAARRREGDLSDDSQQLQDSIKQKDDRIEELEEALKESVNITAEREMVLAQQQAMLSAVEKQLEDISKDKDTLKKHLSATSGKLADTTMALKDKEAKMQAMLVERRKQLAEVLEMKQEALQAAICEKDANIALIEMSSKSIKNARTEEEIRRLKKEKDALVKQLKQQTERRMKLIQQQQNQNGDHNNEDEEEGIWA